MGAIAPLRASCRTRLASCVPPAPSTVIADVMSPKDLSRGRYAPGLYGAAR